MKDLEDSSGRASQHRPALHKETGDERQNVCSSDPTRRCNRSNELVAQLDAELCKDGSRRDGQDRLSIPGPGKGSSCDQTTFLTHLHQPIPIAWLDADASSTDVFHLSRGFGSGTGFIYTAPCYGSSGQTTPVRNSALPIHLELSLDTASTASVYN